MRKIDDGRRNEDYKASVNELPGIKPFLHFSHQNFQELFWLLSPRWMTNKTKIRSLVRSLPSTIHKYVLVKF